VLIFVSRGRLKNKLAEETSAGITKMLGDFEKHKIEVLGFYWTLGRDDTVMIFKAPNKRTAMKMSIDAADVVITEAMVAVTREEPVKLL
jgi:uncharacterized protein with GYD domain